MSKDKDKEYSQVYIGGSLGTHRLVTYLDGETEALPYEKCVCGYEYLHPGDSHHEGRETIDLGRIPTPHRYICTHRSFDDLPLEERFNTMRYRIESLEDEVRHLYDKIAILIKDGKSEESET